EQPRCSDRAHGAGGGRAPARQPGQPAASHPSCVRGSHGRLPDDADDGPLLLCTSPAHARDRFHATEAKDFPPPCSF
ncbi:hypothetical protein AB0C97_32885, partial [Streptomyces goshikiensis]